jgi:hypothetical protein
MIIIGIIGWLPVIAALISAVGQVLLKHGDINF